MARNKQVDGLRGVAILLILVFHIYYRYDKLYTNKSGGILSCFGVLGNTIFLLISSYFLNNNGERNWLKFFALKIKRLWPCYAVSITIIWCTLHLFELPGRMTSIKDYVMNLIYVNGFWGIPYVDGAHWYITTLLAAIFIVGSIAYFRVENYPVTYLMLFLAEGFSKVFKLSVLNKILGSSYIGLICFGICIRKFKLNNYKCSEFHHADNIRKYLEKNQWILTAAVCLIYYGVRNGIVSIVCLCIALPVFLGAINNKFSIFEKSFPQHIGKISYPLYLIHQNIAYTIIYHLSKVCSDYIWLWKAVAFIVVIILGELLFFLVEWPRQKVKKVSCTSQHILDTKL